jgi:hypothetical protein
MFFRFSKYIFFFFEAEPKTAKREVGQGTLVVTHTNAYMRIHSYTCRREQAELPGAACGDSGAAPRTDSGGAQRSRARARSFARTCPPPFLSLQILEALKGLSMCKKV